MAEERTTEALWTPLHSPSRLFHALSLGTRSLSDSVAHIVEALVWILQYKSGAVLSMAANVVVKLLTVIPSSILQQYILDLGDPLLSLLSSNQLEVAISCATAMNMFLSNLIVKKEKQVWEMLKERNTVACIVTEIRKFSYEIMPIDYFQGIASLLSTIMWRWPQSRYAVWNDTVLMKVLDTLLVKPDLSVKVAVVKLYSSLGLCGNAAKKLLDNGEALLQTMVLCMDSSCPLAVRAEGFRLAQCLATNEQSFLRMTSLCCEPLVKAIVCGMNRWSFGFGKILSDKMSLLVEACHLGLVTRWAGKHHIYFWNHGIEKVLLDLILEDFHGRQLQHFSSLEEQITMAQEGLNKNFLHVLRPYIWNILGWLATYCEEDFTPNANGNELHIKVLIICACLEFVNSISMGHQICEIDAMQTPRSESASWAVLMMVYSPCKYISSNARFIFSEILLPNGKDYLKNLLHSLNYVSSVDCSGLSYIHQAVVDLLGLTCYLGLPEYQRHVIEGKGMKIASAFVRWYWRNHMHIKRQRFNPHWDNKFLKRTCCWVHAEEWEGDDVLLLYGLWALAELVHLSGCLKDNRDIYCDEVNSKEVPLVSILQEICNDASSDGPKWFAAYILSQFGFYGFPSKLGKRMGKALNEDEHADIQFILTDGETLSVHSVVLVVRCPSLLPPEVLPFDEKALTNASVTDDAEKIHEKFRKEVRLSAHVDSQALLRLLEYVYFGFLEARDELVNKLKPLAKSCNLQSLLRLLYRKSPTWGTPIPRSDLAAALGPVGQRCSDIILEAKATELSSWTCSVCSLPVPHMHVHKVILWSSCDYLRALFESGMQESHSQTIKVPISWEAMIKLVEWLYTDQLPSPPKGCLWDNIDSEEKLYHLLPYIELCWLADFWRLEGIQDVCYRVIVSCLDSSRELSIKIIQIASKFSLWKLAEVAAELMAPLYNKLRDSGDLEQLDEFLVDMVRTASVRHCQEISLES
ncbi:BTB/POZ domain-containing protein At1g04390 [Pistacia vera]|uniref:BTB/POZ domain-containing protein At1g04390 n=1 Tax=Pistacia vera TaxID=55513 RepID=UPI001263201E|nr:BTB/POZ domain-containing protein At1g04390 [Pistacia vera]